METLGYNEGTADAPVRVLEFSDFGCGYCRQFHLESYPALFEEYMEEGKVEWKYVPMVSGMFENSLAATRAGECAGASLDLDMEGFDECVETGRRDERIRIGSRLFREVGGRGTPTFFVVGYAPIPGAIPLDLFRQVLDTVYVEAMAQQDAGR